VLILHGVYAFSKKVVGYRNDYCLKCNAPRRALQVRSFKVLHLFFVPLVPLGLWREWECSVCGSDPHAQVGTRKSMKWAGVVALIVVAVIAWVGPTKDEKDVEFMWAMRIGCPLAAVALAIHTARSAPDANLSALLKQVPPADEIACALCGGVLISGERWRCSHCGVQRFVVKT
jgi:hypothetical protein